MPRDYVQTAADVSTLQAQILALQNIVNTVTVIGGGAAVTWTDFTASNIWIPVYGDPTLASIAIAATGITIQATNLAVGSLGPFFFGAISRGRFFPDITGVLDLRVNFDSYLPATDGVATRFYRPCFMLCNSSGMLDGDGYPAKGIVYGALPAANKEIADLSGSTFASTNPTSVYNMSAGNQNPIADNSNFFMRMKTTTGCRNANTHDCYVSYAEFNANGGGTVYGGAIAAASWKEYGANKRMMGARLFVGAEQEWNSARFRVRVTGVTLNQGIFVGA